jgi:hypothetical protein
MSVIVFTQNRGHVHMPELPSAWLYGFWTYAYKDGNWLWVGQGSKSGSNVEKRWSPVAHNMVPREFRSYALIAG